MDLYNELFKALKSEGRGLEMVRILKDAASSGLTPTDAKKVLKKLYDEASDEGREEDEDLIVDIFDIARGFCHDRSRIWTIEETHESNEKEVE